MESLLCFSRRDVSDGAMQTLVVVPVDPFQGFPLDLAHGLPGAEEVDHLGFEQADDALCQGIVVGIANAADRGINPSISQPLGILDRQVLAAPVTVMDQLVSPGWAQSHDMPLYRWYNRRGSLETAGHRAREVRLDRRG